MIPLNEIERQELNKGNFAVKFSVHKYNSYITGRTITLEEAARCVVYQTKWAASHTIVDANTKQQLIIDVSVNSETEIKGVGTFVVIDINLSGKSHQSQFIVTESKSHWFFLDYGLANLAQSIEVGQCTTATANV